MEMTKTATADGGTALTLTLTAVETEMLGDDAAHAVAELARGLWAAADLRRGTSRDEWWPVVLDTSRLLRRLEGIRDAALRESPTASHGEIAAALGEPRTTVASRRQKGTLPPAVATTWESWARTGDLPA
ncbi:hypothetical protein [Streptomyces sp. wa13]|uniref:hypothetical protein n=1 Tax=Streptomyces sp. wa13 TaxID=1828236 RepID=UPI003C7D14A5